MAYTVTTVYTIAADARISCVITCTAVSGGDVGYDLNVINTGIGAIQSQTPLFRDNMVATLTLGPYVQIADLLNIVALVLAQVITEIARRRAVIAGKPTNASKSL